MKCTKRIYEILIYTLIRGYLHKGYTHPYIIRLKRLWDNYSDSILFKVLRKII